MLQEQHNSGFLSNPYRELADQGRIEETWLMKGRRKSTVTRMLAGVRLKGGGSVDGDLTFGDLHGGGIHFVGIGRAYEHRLMQKGGRHALQDVAGGGPLALNPKPCHLVTLISGMPTCKALNSLQLLLSWSCE